MLAAYIGPFPQLSMVPSGMCLSTDHGPTFGYVIGGSSTKVYTSSPHNAANSVLCRIERGSSWHMRLPSARLKSEGMGDGSPSDVRQASIADRFLLFPPLPHDCPII